MFWGVQVPKMQTKVDVWKQLGQYGSRMHQVPHKRLSTQANDYDGQLMSRDCLDLKFPDICLMGEEKPRKNLTQEIVPNRIRTHSLRSTHASPTPHWWIF
ncbi:hypothetical protein C0J52_01007 [Blattella germanica]|nr:hypothetical protein C0J52_01007 [Blattella germanica]